MVRHYGCTVVALLWLAFHICSGAPLGNIETYGESQTENAPLPRNQEAFHPYTKKSDMPEKGQIKFMKTLLGKVKTLLHSDDEHSKKGKSKEKKIADYKIPDKIQAVVSDRNSNKLYGVLGNSKENDGEKSVNVISIPLDALKKIVPSEDNFEQEKESGDLGRMPKSTQVLLKPVPVRLANNIGGNKGMTSLVPVVLQNQVPRVEPLRSYRSYGVYPDGPSSAPFGTSRLPFIIERHGDILKHNKGNEELFQDNKGDEGLYRDIGHIPGEIRYHHGPLEDQDVQRRPSLRHENPSRHHRTRYDDDPDGGDEDDEDDEDDGNGDDEDDDDDFDDDSDDRYDYRNSPQMRSEERQIASTRRRLYEMLPGNDPTYTSENRGLGLPMRLGMQMPEAFLGNPMVQPGQGASQKTLMPLLGEALAGEHADNSNDRNVFMFGGHTPKQVFGDSDPNFQDRPMRSDPLKVNSGAFTLGGSQAQAMAPNEVSYMLQKPGGALLSQKNKITHPSHQTHGVLLKVNGRSIGDSSELRDHVVDGVVFKGKEKLIKSKGPMDVKVSKATDGVHSKVVDITSVDKVKVLEEKSKIAKLHGQ